MSAHQAAAVAIEDLPDELLLEVGIELAGRDHYSLMQTCKAMYAALKPQRIAATAAWRAACAALGLLEASFDLDAMTLSEILDIGKPRLALPPRGPGGAVAAEGASPVRKVLVVPCDRDSNGREAYIMRVLVVPGGRYLVCVTAGWVYLWDVRGRGGPELRSLSDGGWEEAIHVAVSEVVVVRGRDCFRFAVCGASEAGAACYRVFEVGPLPRRAEIRVVGTLDCGPPNDTGFVDRPWLCGDNWLFALVDGRFVLWDYVNARAASWATGYATHVSHVAFREDDGVVVTWMPGPLGVVMEVWSVPELAAPLADPTMYSRANEVDSRRMLRWEADDDSSDVAVLESTAPSRRNLGHPVVPRAAMSFATMSGAVGWGGAIARYTLDLSADPPSVAHVSTTDLSSPLLRLSGPNMFDVFASPPFLGKTKTMEVPLDEGERASFSVVNAPESGAGEVYREEYKVEYVVDTHSGPPSYCPVSRCVAFGRACDQDERRPWREVCVVYV